MPPADTLFMHGMGALLRSADRMSPRLAAAVAFRLFNTPIGSGRDQMPAGAVADSRETLAMAEAVDLPVGRMTVRVYHWKADEALLAGRRRRLVLLTHGWTLGARYMTYFVEPLLMAGFDVAALDFPGHGASTRTRRAAPDAVRSIWAAAEAFGGVYAAVAHSFGASMTTLAAEDVDGLTHPLALERLVLIGSADRLSDILDRFCDRISLSPSARARLVRMLEKMGKRPLDHVSVSRALRSLGTPTLVVHDPADRVVPFADAERIATLPRVEVLKAEGMGHMRVLRSSKVAEAVVRFLAAP